MTRAGSKLAGFFGVVFIALAFQFSPLARNASDQLLDLQFRFLRYLGPAAGPESIVIVGIDRETFERFREPLALWHPHIGAFLEAMAAARPRVLILDVVLPDRSYEFISPGYDKPLLSGLLKFRDQKTLVLAQTINERGQIRRLYPPIVALAGRESIGLALVRPDADGVVRRVAPYLDSGSGKLATLFGKTLAVLGMRDVGGLIDYSVGKPFSYLPMQNVLALQQAGETEKLKRLFAGKEVFVGAVLPFTDRQRVPVALAGWEPDNRLVPGVLIHAQAIRSALAGKIIQPAPPVIVVLLTFAGCLIWWVSGNGYRGIAALLLGNLTLGLGASYLLGTGVTLPMAGIGFALFTAFAGRIGLESVFAYVDRHRLKRSFERYVSPNVLEAIISGRISPETGGVRCRVCVLFSDVRDFTTRSEHQPPEEIISLLNDYFEEMTAAVHRYDGTIDKFIGDGLMAFFGAPKESENPAQDAFSAAKDMLTRLEALNRKLEVESTEPIQIGIGLEFGDVVVGHVGSRQRNEYTVIGDTVNTAARLETLTKALGFPVVVSAKVAAVLESAHELVDLGEQEVKGRAPVRVFGWRQIGSSE